MKNYSASLLGPYIEARYSILSFTSPEENRLELLVEEAINDLKKAKPDLDLNVLTWTHTGGLECIMGVVKNLPTPQESQAPEVALAWILNSKIDAIFLFKDLQPFFDYPMVARYIRDISADFKTATMETTKGTIKPLYRTMILTSPSGEIPNNLKHDITALPFDLPGPDLLKIAAFGKNPKKENIELAGGDEGVEATVEACRGLTASEASDATSRALIIKRRNPKDTKIPTVAQMVMEEKAETIRKSGVLEWYNKQVGLQNIGGLEILKDWLEIRKKTFSKEAREYGIPAPRGMLLAGVPGCGKSLAAKATAMVYDSPLIKFDVGRVFGGIVGESEANMRLAIKTVEAIGKCVLWVDELDKAFAGVTGASGDSGTSQRVFGNFITWMQEKTAPVFIVATANRIGGLPPELLRKGRFDEIFFVDLPSYEERKQILGIHVANKKKGLKLNLDKCAEASESFSGAELEEAVISALCQAFYNDSELNADYILEAIKKTNPLAKTRAKEVQDMREWAIANAVNASKSSQQKEEKPSSKKTLGASGTRI